MLHHSLLEAAAGLLVLKLLALYIFTELGIA